MKSFIMDFQISGIIRQKVLITAKGWTEEMVVDGLNSGILETTIGHDGIATGSETITDCEGLIIGRIELQRSVEGMEFHNFGDSTDIDLDMMGSDIEDAAE